MIPLEMQVASVVTTPESHSWSQSSLAMVSVMVSPHAVQVYVLMPSELSVGCFVITPESQECPLAGTVS